MRYLRWFFLLLLTSMPAMSFAGDIQILCEPALKVYLDDKFVGTSSSKEDGLFLANVPGGAHVVRVEKDEFAPQRFQVEVQEVPIQVRVGEFSPKPLAAPEAQTGGAKITPSARNLKATQAPGNLIVTSAPQNCVVEVDGKPEVKSVPLLRIEDLAAGQHAISFSKPGYDRISGVVKIQPGADVTVRGDFSSGKLETINEGKGSLRVISTPEVCTVRFLGKTQVKTHLRLNISYIPAGEHRIVVMWQGRELSSNVVISNRHRTIVTVSFIKGEEPFVFSYEPE